MNLNFKFQDCPFIFDNFMAFLISGGIPGKLSAIYEKNTVYLHPIKKKKFYVLKLFFPLR